MRQNWAKHLKNDQNTQISNIKLIILIFPWSPNVTCLTRRDKERLQVSKRCYYQNRPVQNSSCFFGLSSPFLRCCLLFKIQRIGQNLINFCNHRIFNKTKEPQCNTHKKTKRQKDRPHLYRAPRALGSTVDHKITLNLVIIYVS